MPLMTPRAQRHENVRRTILKTTLTLIHTKGIARLSLREIARRTGYSPASLYEYFDSKDDIIATLRAEGLKRLGDHLARLPADWPPPRRLVEMGLAYLDFASHQPEYFELIFSQLPSKRGSLLETADAGSPYGLVLRVVNDGLADGSVILSRAINAESVAYSLWAFVHGMAVLQAGHLRNFEADFPALHRRTLELFVSSLSR